MLIGHQFGPILSPHIGGSTMGLVRRLLSGDRDVFGIIPGRKCHQRRYGG
jgi:hypothetical protein